MMSVVSMEVCMPKCPKCTVEMIPVPENPDILYLCPNCNHAVVSVSTLLMNGRERASLLALRQDVTDNGSMGTACPGCGLAMKSKRVSSLSGTPIVEVCSYCNYAVLPAKSLDEIPMAKRKVPDFKRKNFKKDFRDIEKNLDGEKTLNKAYSENKHMFTPLKQQATLRHMFFPELINGPYFENSAVITYIYTALIILCSILYNYTGFFKSLSDMNSLGSVDVFKQLFVFDEYSRTISVFMLVVAGRVIEGIVGSHRMFIYITAISILHLLGVYLLYGDFVTAPTMVILTVFNLFLILFPMLDILGAIWIRIMIFPYLVKVWVFGVILYSVYALRAYRYGDYSYSILYVIGISVAFAVILLIISGGKKQMYEDGEIE